MRSTKSFRSAFALSFFVLTTAACDYYAKPNRALPRSFAAKTLDGRRLVPESMRGKPWIINLWLPG
jgi:hypothetical protein